MLTEADIRDALRVCFDPVLPVNIVDLGLVHGVSIVEDTEAPGSESRFHVHIHLLRRTTDETREAMLLAQVENRLMGLQSISQARASIVDTPAWTADLLTSDARQRLLPSPSAPLVQIRL